MFIKFIRINDDYKDYILIRIIVVRYEYIVTEPDQICNIYYFYRKYIFSCWHDLSATFSRKLGTMC